MTTDNTWFLWNHDDGRYGVAPAGVTPPDWHPAGPVEMLAQPPSGQSAAIIEAWMDPETLDVIHAERKAAWENEYGAGGVSKAAGYTVAMTRAQPAAATVSADAVLRDAIAHGVGGYIEIDGRQIHIPAEVLPGEQPSATAPADGVRAALTNLVREAQAVADDYHRPRYARLDDAIASARAALAAPAAPRESTLPYEQALYELINKIDTGLDTGDILADARRASAALDGILAAGDLVANAHDHFKQAGVLADHYEQSVDFRIGWNACLDAIAHARRAAPAAPFDWRELARRLYVELFHCDQQMCSTRDEDGDPTWTTGATVRDVLRDANAALKAAPAVQAAPTIKESLQVAAPQAGEDDLPPVPSAYVNDVYMGYSKSDLHSYARAALAKKAGEDARPVTWPEAETIASIPAVDEALAAFSNDSTFDNAVGVVLAAISASKPAAQAAPAVPGTTASRDVLAERQRQISVEGWTPEHDDEHNGGELSAAAASYAIEANALLDGMRPDATRGAPFCWQWDPAWWKPSADPRRNLVKAGALILAEIERLDRAALTTQGASHG